MEINIYSNVSVIFVNARRIAEIGDRFSDAFLHCFFGVGAYWIFRFVDIPVVVGVDVKVDLVRRGGYRFVDGGAYVRRRGFAAGYAGNVEVEDGVGRAEARSFEVNGGRVGRGGRRRNEDRLRISVRVGRLVRSCSGGVFEGGNRRSREV